MATQPVKKAKKLLVSPQSFPAGTSQEFRDVFYRVLDILNGTQGTAYTAEGTATTANQNANAAQETANQASQTLEETNKKVNQLESDSISSSNTGLQSLVGALGISNSLRVDGDIVVRKRETGWSSNTGDSKKGGSAALTLTVSNPPTQAEVQAIANAVIENRQLITALISLVTYHGLAGA